MSKSRWVVVAVAVCLLVTVAAVACAAEQAMSLTTGAVPPYPRHVSWVALRLPDGREARIYYGEKLVYMKSLPPVKRVRKLLGIPLTDDDTANESANERRDATVYQGGHLAVRVGSDTAISNKYVKLLDGGRGTFTFRSSDPAVIRVSDETSFVVAGLTMSSPGGAGGVGFLRPGKATITVGFMGGSGTGAVPQSVNIALEVVQLPIWDGMTKDEVIHALGVPDDRNSGYVSWPDSKVVDGVYYDTSGNPYGISYEHWCYKRYPGLVLRMETDGLVRLHQKGWQHCADFLDQSIKELDSLITELNKPLPYCGWQPVDASQKPEVYQN